MDMINWLRQSSRLRIATLLLRFIVVAVLIQRAPATSQSPQTSLQTRQFRGQVVSGSDPLEGATVHLVPVTAIDTTTPMTASSIYAPPYPAESYDEPLEDAIRLKGAGFPQTNTDARGNFVIPNVPAGKFFVHVIPSPGDTAHLPGGDISRKMRRIAWARYHVNEKLACR